jgi:hypothetical protein
MPAHPARGHHKCVVVTDVLTTTCDFYAKEGDLHAQWVRETRGIRAIAMSLSV